MGKFHSKSREFAIKRKKGKNNDKFLKDKILTQSDRMNDSHLLRNHWCGKGKVSKSIPSYPLKIESDKF